ncbi:MAG: hypothetical protein U1C04_18765 [Hydrogenophaga sp.]|uniref:hypothetical protein n=1 Tax=Hydrogenophaga sp. TaxID=1904254 RepID=UPI002AB94400|nr:hypothetical protein [Hydrogenophaga sp.]MDZ4282793.1 hypothetical protein [Hydrogenophaga sp.]
MSAAASRLGVVHTPATARIQARWEGWELQHLRALCAEQAEEIERLKREVEFADACADMHQRLNESLEEALHDSSAGARCLGLTKSGELLVINTGAMQ